MVPTAFRALVVRKLSLTLRLEKLRQGWDNKSAVWQGLSVILPRLLLKDAGELRTFKFKWLNGNLTPG
ncbi:hypothetical protein LAL4801_01852 [Roseibium aggregatum]|uniref:Uncharacterized protein n=1 Tax=Roseibium aggregatum TaxID=187304 RepID=A0A0M6Y152_9HYPH|nr:hypothetical protein LAL4801_01852 [Roseibium aggregatum]